jgi:nucleotide-binding universal stress UspA family protein
MLLGWIAGTMTVTDPALVNPDMIRYGAGVVGALLVLAIGKLIVARRGDAAAPAAAAAAAPAAAGRLRRILLAVDGSEVAQRATKQVIAMRQDLAQAPVVQMVHVQRPVSGDVSSFVANKTLEEYYQEQSDAALAPSKALLDAAGVPYEAVARIGTPGETIAKEAQAAGADLIVMGTKGVGAAATFLGSVAQETIADAGVPVMLVK